jgi:hypothetical protein
LAETSERGSLLRRARRDGPIRLNCPARAAHRPKAGSHTDGLSLLKDGVELGEDSAAGAATRRVARTELPLILIAIQGRFKREAERDSPGG